MLINMRVAEIETLRYAAAYNLSESLCYVTSAMSSNQPLVVFTS